jgi:hypothetical protein
MTFKEKLIDKMKHDTIDVSEDISFIKKEMESTYALGKLYIFIAKDRRFAAAYGTPGVTCLYTPNNITPEAYRQKLIEGLKELGFVNGDIGLEDGDIHLGITVKWKEIR